MLNESDRIALWGQNGCVPPSFEAILTEAEWHSITIGNSA